MQNRTFTSALLLWVTLVFSSCTQIRMVVETKSTITPEPQVTLTPTQTITPKPTVTITPTKIPEVESGKVEENSAKGSYVQMYNMNEWFGGKHPNKENIYYKMYESYEWTEKGLQIVTPLGDIILIENPEPIGNNLLSIKFRANGVITSELIISKGTIINYTTWVLGNSVEETIEQSYTWGFFDSRTGNLIDCTRSGSCRFENAVIIGISENWVLRQDLGKNTLKKGDLLVPLWVVDGTSFKEFGIKLFTYRFEDGEIYRFGPPPLIGPYVRIKYY